MLRAALLLLPASLLVASCVVDKSGLVFDDEQFEALGGQNGSGGGVNTGGGSGAEGGQGGEGGLTGTGGLGGGGALCEPNEMQCDGKQVELCHDGAWLPIGGECPNACVDGACAGMCSPGADECLSGIQTQHCNDVGEWESEFCEFACVGGTCGGVCRPGDRDCNGDVRTLCGETGEWEEQDTCPGDCEAGVCVGACPLGDTQCSGDAENPIQITCDAATWEESSTEECEFICDEATGECGGECVPFTSACASSTTVQVCDSTATYGAPENCDYVCNQSTGACDGECTPGSRRCSSSSIQVCDNTGHWVGEATCSGEAPYCLEASPGEPKCVECAPGAKKCSPTENALLTCSSSGQWPQSGAACMPFKGTATVCWAEPREPAACIPVTAIECPAICLKGSCPAGCIDSNTRWYCSSGTLKTSDCSLGTSCYEGVCE